MNLLEISDKTAWESFHGRQPWSQFTQSWAWGEFRRSRGFPVRRFALVDDTGEWLLAAQCELRPKPLVGGYWFAPRGPVFHSLLPTEDVRNTFIAFLERLLALGLSRSLFWRFEPVVELGRPEGLFPMSFRRNDPVNPMSTVLLDLSLTRDELLAEMHQKTRYNIRVAERHGITTRIATHADDVKAFLDLMDETASRDGFTSHDRGYLKATFETLEREGMARIRLAVREGKVYAANVEIVCNDTVTYVHGASSSDARNVMAPFALHWDAIMQAKRDGHRWYDFWGVNPLSKAAFAYKPSWEGITRFKRGWGGRQVDLYGTWDLPFLLPLYRLVYFKHFPRS